MKRIAVLAATVGTLLVFGIGGQASLHTPPPAEASTTTWIWPTTPAGYPVAGGQALVNTELFVTPACTGCYITRMEPDLIYKGDPSHTDGTTANFNNSNTTDGAWLHHFVIIDDCNPEIRLIASGNERSILQSPPGYGYYMAPGCNWILNYHIHNNGTNTRTVAIRLNVTYQTTPLLPTTPVWLDTGTTQNSSQFTIPTGYSDTHTGSGAPDISPDYTMSVQGKIIGMGGHVHDWGISVASFNTGAGDRPDDWICTSVAGYGSGSGYLPTGGPGTPGHPASAVAETLNPAYSQPGTPPTPRYHIQDMTPCGSITDRMSVICAGDVIRLHTQYNNGDTLPVTDAMGIMVAYLATPPNVPDADGDGTWDGCDTGDSDGDTFSDRVEVAIGTFANDACANVIGDPAADAWPADINNSRFSDTADIAFLTGDFGKSTPPEEARHSIQPDPVDIYIDTADIARMTSQFGRGCTP